MLELYGVPLVKYSGRCTLISYGGVHVKGRFQVIQLDGGGIYFYAQISAKEQKKNWPRVQDFTYQSPEKKIQKITGSLDDGRVFGTEGDLFLIRLADYLPIGRKTTKLAFRLQAFTVGNKRVFHTRKRMRFHFTNLMFLGVEWHKEIRDQKRVAFRKTKFNLKNSLFTIFPRSDYNARVEQMRLTNQCTVTSYCDVEQKRKRKETVLDLMDTLCLLLSFAKGTQVNWIYYEEFGRGKKPSYAYHADRITRDYSSLKVINELGPNLLPQFLTTTSKRFIQLLEDFPMNKLIGTIIVAKLNGSFIELRALQLVSMVDVLCGLWAQKNDRVNIIDPTLFASMQARMVGELTSLLETSFHVPHLQAGSMSQHAQGFNRYSFGSNLRRVVRIFSARISPAEIHSFIETRNSLVHKGEFFTSEKMREFLGIVSFSDRLILGMLGFRGEINNPLDLLGPAP